MDVFLYSGALARGDDLQFIQHIHATQKSKSVTLILVTFGGSPDAAYKIGRYLQKRYDSITVLIPGLCKSAGTLLAFAGTELAFTPYGELGPLDIQLTKTDKIAGMESGLSIRQAFDTLEQQAVAGFHSLVQEIVSSTGGIVSFQTASHSASEIIGALYGPIFGRIDPEEVGSRTRAMQIAAHYGVRLNAKYQNLKQSMEYLVQTYPSHGFVIDHDEACEIFHRVREASPREKALVESLGMRARFPGTSVDIACLTEEYEVIKLETDYDEEPAEHVKRSLDHNVSTEPGVDGGDSSPAGKRRSQRTNGSDAAVGVEVKEG